MRGGRHMAESGSLVHCLPKKTSLKQGEYIIEEVLGQGGFGITYLGIDTSLLCPVAIKEYFPSGIAGRDVTEKEDYNLHIYGKDAKEEYEKGMQAFISEARLLARFKEIQGIVKVHNFFRENSTAYIVMEYVDGQSVKQHIRRMGKIPPSEVLAMMGQAMQVLESVHQHRFVHRDVSVDNFMISKEGRLILIDFGAARYTNALDEKTRTMMCKQGFSAIEQYSTAGKQGPWTDVYGMCATMYYMLTGILPQNSTDRVLRDEVVSLVDMTEIDLSQSQKEAIMKGMEVDRIHRYQSMKELYQGIYGEAWTQQKGIILEGDIEQTGLERKKEEPVIIPKDHEGMENLKSSKTTRGHGGMTFTWKLVTNGTLLSKTALGRELKKMSKKRDSAKRKKQGMLFLLVLTVLLIIGGSVSYWYIYSKDGGAFIEDRKQKERVMVTEKPSEMTEATMTPKPSVTPAKETIEKTKVPALLGETKKAAIKAVKKAGLAYQLKYKETNQMLPGYVMKQSLSAEREVKKGKKIILTISKQKKVTATPIPPTQAPSSTSNHERKEKTTGMAGDIDSALQ